MERSGWGWGRIWADWLLVARERRRGADQVGLVGVGVHLSHDEGLVPYLNDFAAHDPSAGSTSQRARLNEVQ